MPGLIDIDPIKAAKAIGGTVIVGFVLYKGYGVIKKYQAKGELTKDQASTVTAKPGKTLFTIAGKPIRSMNLSTIVVDLHDALSFPADQARAVRVFMTIPFGYVKKVEAMYLDKYGDNLKQKLVDKLSDANWIKVKFYFE